MVRVFSTNITLEWVQICRSTYEYECLLNGKQSYRISILRVYPDESSRHYITVPIPEGTNEGDMLNYTVSGLRPSSTYIFQVTFMYGNSERYHSESVTATTLASINRK